MMHKIPAILGRGSWALRPATTCERRTGFTAFEALLASTILALVASAVSTALMAGRQQSALAQKTTYASLIGRAMMDEVLRFPYGDQTNAPDANEFRRPNINVLSDYNNFTDGPNNLKDLAGNLLPTEYQELTRTVTIAPTTLTPTGWSTSVSGEMVTVTVALNGQTLITLQRFIPPT